MSFGDDPRRPRHPAGPGEELTISSVAQDVVDLLPSLYSQERMEAPFEWEKKGGAVVE